MSKNIAKNAMQLYEPTRTFVIYENIFERKFI